ncbi:MAG: SLC13 family permease, partial [Bacteroidota bacterium]
IGDAPNQIIAITQGIPFIDFLWAMTPVNFLSEMVFLFMISCIFRRYQRQMRAMNASDRAEAMLAGDLTSRIIAFDYRSTKIDKRFATPSAITATLMIIGFVLSGAFDLPLPLVALVGAVATLVFVPNGHEFIRSAKIKDVLIMSCLFAMAGAVQATGIIKYIGNLIPKVAKGNSLIAMDLLVILSGVMTVLCSAGPTAATLVPLAANFVQIVPSHPNLPFFAMSFGVLAGSSTNLYSATAGPIVASRMEEIAGVPLGFWDFLRIGWKVFLVFELIALCFISMWIILTG